MRSCDVVIPIFNAYDSVIECVDSVIASTDLKNNRLVLIDDKSTDERITPLLKKYKKDNPDINLEVYKNETNLGFVKTVNKGMRLSKENDVLLLNSDTEVSERWLEKIKKCAYTSDDVATVTPLSNNATLVSVPNMLQPNPYNLYDLDEYNKMLEDISVNNYQELPTAHGFCMYIKREVLDYVGYFDEESFGTGYGEENDFCYRCLNYGYRHLLCEDTLVYHKESQSFINTRAEVVNEHMKIIRNMHKEHCFQTDYWLKYLPIRTLASRIAIGLTLMNKKPNVLCLIHEMDSQKGGTTIHMLDIIQNLNDKYNFIVFWYNDKSRKYELKIYNGKEEFVIPLIDIHSYSSVEFYNSEYRKLCEAIIKTFNVDVIHVHHMKSHYFDIVDLAKQYNIKTIISLHDYYCLCPNVNLLENGLNYCVDIDKPNCDDCIKCLKIYETNIVDKWRNNWYKFLKQFDYIVSPSATAKNIVGKYYNNLNIRVVEHGVENSKSDYVPDISEGKFNVAFVGVLCNHKGGQVFDNLIKYRHKGIMFHAFGDSAIKSMKKSKSNYIYHGRYNKNNLGNLLKENDIDLVCFLQQWPETYSYTLTEVSAAGIPILTLDMGAGAERVRKNNLGWVIDKDSKTDSIINSICNIRNNDTEYKEVLKSISKYKPKSICEMAKDYSDMYLCKNRILDSSSANTLLPFLWKNTTDSQTLADIYASRKYRLINKIRIPNRIRRLVRYGD